MLVPSLRCLEDLPSEGPVVMDAFARMLLLCRDGMLTYTHITPCLRVESDVRWCDGDEVGEFFPLQGKSRYMDDKLAIYCFVMAISTRCLLTELGACDHAVSTFLVYVLVIVLAR